MHAPTRLHKIPPREKKIGLLFCIFFLMGLPTVKCSEKVPPKNAVITCDIDIYKVKQGRLKKIATITLPSNPSLLQLKKRIAQKIDRWVSCIQLIQGGKYFEKIESLRKTPLLKICVSNEASIEFGAIKMKIGREEPLKRIMLYKNEKMTFHRLKV
ncbi:MAG: hypothetical protein ACPGC9_02290, partial [Cytophagales bacterium]